MLGCDTLVGEWGRGGSRLQRKEEDDRGGFCVETAPRRQPILPVSLGPHQAACGQTPPPPIPPVLTAGAQVSRTNTGVHKLDICFLPSNAPGYLHPPCHPKDSSILSQALGLIGSALGLKPQLHRLGRSLPGALPALNF